MFYIYERNEPHLDVTSYSRLVYISVIYQQKDTAMSYL